MRRTLIIQRVGLALGSGLVIGSFVVDAAAGGPPPSPTRDITRTVAGRRAAQDAADRISSRYGVATDAASLAVWAIGDRLIVGPAGSTIIVNQSVGPHGIIRRLVEATEPPPGREGPVTAPMPGAEIVASDASVGWQLVGDHCWTDSPREFTWMDVCYHKFRATSDGSSSYDYYALQMFSTFAAPGPGLEIGDPWIEAAPDSKGAGHTWFDWSPRADTTRACGDVSLSVRVNELPLTASATQCETWDITKYGTAGRFRNKWTEGFCQSQQGERELAFEIVSRVAQGKVPRWVFPWFENVQLAGCLG